MYYSSFRASFPVGMVVYRTDIPQVGAQGATGRPRLPGPWQTLLGWERPWEWS